MQVFPLEALRLFGLALFLGCTASASSAATAEDLDDLPPTQACTNELVNLGHILDARDKGVSKAQVVAFSKSVQSKDAVPREAIDNMYAVPRLDRNLIGMYSAVACHARAYGVPVQPLAKFETKLRECMEKPKSDPCGRAIRNEIVGLPSNFMPKRSPPPAPRQAPGD